MEFSKISEKLSTLSVLSVDKILVMFLISVSNGMFHLTPIKMCHLNVCFAGICIICYVNMFLPLRRQGVSFYCLGFLTSMYYGFAAFKVQLLLL